MEKDGAREYIVKIKRHSSRAPWTYHDLDLEQRRIAEQIRNGSASGGLSGVLMINELAPVITFGRRTEANTDLILPRSEYENLGIQVVPVDRGGLATWHGPGHWVVFPVFTLEHLTGDRTSIRKVIDSLLEFGLKLAQAYEPRCEVRRDAELGVWSPRGKVISVGVRVEQGVLLHGLGINGYRTPLSFQGLRPCGLDASVDYLISTDEGAQNQFLELGNEVSRSFAAFFGLSPKPGF